MRLRSELELLATLDAATIGALCADHTLIPAVITDCLDESWECDDLADAAQAAGDDDLADFHRQEAAAWRATARVLRSATPEIRSGERRTERGVA
ncbi:hypothetical protein ABLE92_21095 [Gordonia sp. VNQ95]|jgi:hypothetical protein|uniref:hypothetical protein n=1 Tax=Gordonia TaxID=2053 RepID=UPI0032B4E29A